VEPKSKYGRQWQAKLKLMNDRWLRRPTKWVFLGDGRADHGLINSVPTFDRIATRTAQVFNHLPPVG
jgi:hypothetical protein